MKLSGYLRTTLETRSTIIFTHSKILPDADSSCSNLLQYYNQLVLIAYMSQFTKPGSSNHFPGHCFSIFRDLSKKTGFTEWCGFAWPFFIYFDDPLIILKADSRYLLQKAEEFIQDSHILSDLHFSLISALPVKLKSQNEVSLLWFTILLFLLMLPTIPLSLRPESITC